MTIKQMQDNIIRVLGFEHPTTIDFFNLCEQFESFPEVVYDEYVNIIKALRIVQGGYNLAHIHCNVVDGYTDDIIKVVVVELNNKQYEKFIDILKDIALIVCSNGNDYINIIDIIIE